MRGTAAKRSMDLTAARHERRVRAEVHKLDLKIERTKEELFPEYFGKDAYIMMPSSSDDRGWSASSMFNTPKSTLRP